MTWFDPLYENVTWLLFRSIVAVSYPPELNVIWVPSGIVRV